MTDPVTIMGAGLRTEDAMAIIADIDGLVTLSVSDGTLAGVSSILMPAYAARHLGEQLIRKAAEIERMAAAEDAESQVIRGDRSDFACPPMG